MASGVDFRLILGSVVQVLGVTLGVIGPDTGLLNIRCAGDRHVSILYSDHVRFASLKYLKLMLRYLVSPSLPVQKNLVKK